MHKRLIATVSAGMLMVGGAALQSPASAAPATQGQGTFQCSNGAVITVSFVRVERIAFSGPGAVSARAFSFEVQGQVHVDGGGGLPDYDASIDESQPPHMGDRLVSSQALTDTTPCAASQTFGPDQPLIEAAGPDDIALLGIDPGYVGHNLTFMGIMTNTAYLTTQQLAART